MPRETHKAVRDAQRENGIIWRKEEVRPGGLEEGSEEETAPCSKRQGARLRLKGPQACGEPGTSP